MMRQLGGSFGIAILTTLIHVKSGINRNILRENINPYNPAFSEKQQAFIQGFQSKGYSTFDAQQMANRAIEGSVIKQTMLVTYDNIYLLVGVFVLCCIPLVYLQKFKKSVALPVDVH
jgi:DHA2 family multidrug resistance protein